MTIVRKVPAKPTKDDMNTPWFVRFKFVHEGREHTIKQQRKINYEKDYKKRVALHNALQKAVEQELERGWNPITNTFPNRPDHTFFNKSLDYALTKGSWSSKTLRDYSCTVRFVQAAAIELGLDQKPVIDIERQDIKAILERVKKNRKWSNTAYNKNLGYFQAVMSQLLEWELIKYNPAHKIKSLPVTETQKYVPLSSDEKRMIKERFVNDNPRFYAFLMVLFQTGVRPKEILSLKIKNLDLQNQIITILPDRQEENSKTKNIRRVPFGSQLLGILKGLNLQAFPPEYYIFGSPFLSGKGNKGSQSGKSGANRSDYFVPSPTQIKRDTVTKLWNKLVIQGLGIKKHLYALKHSGADSKILAGIDIDALKELYGHSSKQMTNKYITVLQEINRKKIIEGSPDF